MEHLFLKMGLEDAAGDLFRKLERNLDPKVSVEAFASGVEPEPDEDGLLTFWSAPVAQKGRYLRVALRLRKSAFDAYYAMHHKRVAPGYHNVASLLDATVHEFLRLCPDAIQAAEGDRLIVRLGRDVEELLRAAGARLMFNPVVTNGYGETYARRLFFDCNAISYLRYERAETTGRLLLARRGHPNVEPVLTRRTALPISDHRAVRKVLELSSDDLPAAGDGYQVYGLARLTGRYDETRQDLYAVRFVGQSNWEFYHGAHLLMRVVDGRPELPDIQLESRFETQLREMYPGISASNIESLWSLVQAAGEARRGAVVVISEEAAAEAARLEPGCTRVEPVKMGPKLMRRVCAIDGAVLLDPSGVCHAIGVILDGMASATTGDASRGARFNSALRYARSVRHPSLIAVVSEDGGTDLLTSGST
jgi:sensor domain DACNH-containing protein/sensor domain DACNG-containing protein/DisA checkpoint controller-like protein